MTRRSGCASRIRYAAPLTSCLWFAIRMKITATIITLNEERNLPRALESLRCCDEILVVDCGSIDRTVEIAKDFGARAIQANWRGYAGQKNYASDQAA